MKNKSNLVAYGLMSLALVLGIFLSVKSVNQSQDTRSSAAEEETMVVADEETIDGVCGSANGQVVEAAPDNEEACDTGAINWYDSEATDGEFNWTCIGTEDGMEDECTAEVSQ